MIILTIKFASYPKPIHFRGTIVLDNSSQGGWIVIEEVDGTHRAIHIDLAEWYTVKEAKEEKDETTNVDQRS